MLVNRCGNVVDGAVTIPRQVHAEMNYEVVRYCSEKIKKSFEVFGFEGLFYFVRRLNYLLKTLFKLLVFL